MMDLIFDPKMGAEAQMQRDFQLVENLSALKEPLLRFYEWQGPTITYGYFIDPKKHLKNTHLFDLARRPTGGGILFHVQDFTFTFALPASHPRFSMNVLENYRLVNEAVQEAVSAVKKCHFTLFHTPSEGALREFCMATPTHYDLMVEGKKVGGSAERKTKFGFVHEACIFLIPPPWSMFQEVLIDDKILQTMQQKSTSLLETSATPQEVEELRHELQSHLSTILKKRLAVC